MTQIRHSIFKSAVLSAFGLMTGGAVVATAAGAPPTIPAPNQSANDLHVQTADGRWVILRPNGHGAFLAYRRAPDKWTLVPILNEKLTLKTNGSEATVTVAKGQVLTDEITRIRPKMTGWNETGIPAHVLQ